MECKKDYTPKSVNGVNIYPFRSFKDVIDFSCNKNQILVAINSRKIINKNKDLKAIINSNIGYIDGFGAQLALKKKYGINLPKLPGCELWLEILKRYSDEKSFYFIGATDKVINNSIKKIYEDFPKINILGFRDGFFKDDKEIDSLIKDLNKKRPEMVFVAMGSPKQEFFISNLLKFYPAFYMGLGGSFDVYTARVQRAPKWWVNNNLEWAYRHLNQPKRIKSRIVPLIKFIFNLYLRKY